MTRYMYDSVNPAAVPQDSELVAYYIDGAYAWPQSAIDRFQRQVHVPIAVLPSTNDGIVLDVETGDATPTDAPAWVVMRRAAGRDPAVYMNASTWPKVRQAFAYDNVPEPHYWVAQWDGDPSIPAGAVAKQYANPAITGIPVDFSAVVDYWPGVDPVPVTPPSPPPPGPPPPSPPPPVTQLDAVRASWGNLGDFLVSALPAAITDLLRLAGLFRAGS